MWQLRCALMMKKKTIPTVTAVSLDLGSRPWPLRS